MTDHELKVALLERLDWYTIGEKATSYKQPLVVGEMKIWEDKVCIDCKNIKGKYIVFDRKSFIEHMLILLNKNNNEEHNE